MRASARDTRRDLVVCFAWKQVWVRVFQSSLKTTGGATAGGARDTIAEVVSESNQRRMDQCDELRRTLLPLLYRYRSIRP
jgi:hypothetical protein